MLDVMQIAIEYKKKLLRDVDRIDAFLRTADELARQGGAPSLSPRAILPKTGVTPLPDEPRISDGRATQTQACCTETGNEQQAATEISGGSRGGLSFRNACEPRDLDRKRQLA